MALDKTTLAASIKSAFSAAIGVDDDGAAVSNAIANAIDIFVKSGTVSTVVSTPDTVNGTGTGAVA